MICLAGTTFSAQEGQQKQAVLCPAGTTISGQERQQKQAVVCHAGTIGSAQEGQQKDIGYQAGTTISAQGGLQQDGVVCHTDFIESCFYIIVIYCVSTLIVSPQGLMSYMALPSGGAGRTSVLTSKSASLLLADFLCRYKNM